MNQQIENQLHIGRAQRRKHFLFTTVFFSMALCGCATMIKGSKQEIRVHCEPTDYVNVVVDGSEVPFSDGVIFLDKQRDLHFVTFSKSLHNSSTVAFNRRVNTFWMVADLIWLPAFPIAWLVDWATGSIFKIDPQNIHVVLRSTEREVRWKV